MPIKNIFKINPVSFKCHGGEGNAKLVGVFDKPDFQSGLNFIHYTTLPPLVSIGLHTHGNDEEVYIVLEGSGVMETDGQKIKVKKGDVILNPPFGTHSLINTSTNNELKILVFSADCR